LALIIRMTLLEYR